MIAAVLTALGRYYSDIAVVEGIVRWRRENPQVPDLLDVRAREWLLEAEPGPGARAVRKAVEDASRTRFDAGRDELVVVTGPGTGRVRSATDTERWYEVNIAACSCLGFLYRKECRHLRAFREALASTDAAAVRERPPEREETRTG